jgi:hypothetical protein
VSNGSPFFHQWYSRVYVRGPRLLAKLYYNTVCAVVREGRATMPTRKGRSWIAMWDRYQMDTGQLSLINVVVRACTRY